MYRRLYLTRCAAFALSAATLLNGCSGDATKSVAPALEVSARGSMSSNALVRPQGDSEGVLATVSDFDDAWNAWSATRIAGLFADDAEFVNGRGQVAVGTEAIRAQHAGLFAGAFARSHLESTVRRITFLSGTTAVVDVDTQLTGFTALPPGTNPTEPGKQRGRHKRVLVKRGGEWQMVLMQITTVAPAP